MMKTVFQQLEDELGRPLTEDERREFVTMFLEELQRELHKEMMNQITDSLSPPSK